MTSTVDCEHGDRCAGCTHLGVSYAAQLGLKRERVERSLRRYPWLDALDVGAPLGAEPVTGYRTRVKWMVGPHGELGLYSRESAHTVVDVAACQVASPALAEAGASIRTLLARPDLRGIELLRAVDLRELRDESSSIWATLVFARDAKPDAEALAKIAHELRRLSPFASVFVNEVESGSVQVLGATTTTIVGDEEAWDRVAGARILAAPGSFVQAHGGQALAIAERLRERCRSLGDSLGRPPRVLDLFAGSGTWGLASAAEGATVVAVESYGPAAKRIVESARVAGLNVVARAEDAERAIAALARARESFDLVIVNPPRRGISPGVRAGIVALAPKAVAYVSCDPSTLARDLMDFVRLGLAASSVLPIDMIPLTEHVESLVWLEPSEPPPPSILATTDELLFFDKPPHETPEALAGRVARTALAGALLCAPAAAASGIAVFAQTGVAAANLGGARAHLVCAVKGVIRGRGTLRDREGRAFRYVRRAIASGHSLLGVECALEDVPHLIAPFAAIGHPPLGSRATDPRTRRHFADRHGLDRSFVHLEKVEVWGLVVLAPLAPDLQVVAETIGFPPRGLTSTGSTGCE